MKQSPLHSNVPIGVTYEMPGTPAWTMCVFSAEDVPAGTKVYKDGVMHKPLASDQIYASEEMMHLNGSLLQLDMSQLMLLVRAVENLHNIK